MLKDYKKELKEEKIKVQYLNSELCRITKESDHFYTISEELVKEIYKLRSREVDYKDKIETYTTRLKQANDYIAELHLRQKREDSYIRG